MTCCKIQKIMWTPPPDDRDLNNPGFSLPPAANNGQLDLVNKILAEKNVMVDYRDNGFTPLILATEKGYLEIVKALLKAGADPNLQDKYGDTALMSAAGLGLFEIVKSLLQAGADVNIQNSINGSNALIRAVNANNLEIVKTFLKMDGNLKLDIQERYQGYTALMYAVRLGNMETVRALLEAGANPSLLSENGKSAYNMCGYAFSETKEECQDILKDGVKKYYRSLRREETPKIVSSAAPNLPIIPKDVWRDILKRRLQLELCADLSSSANEDLLLTMAQTDFGVPKEVIDTWKLEKTKSELCEIISGLLSIGAMYSENALDYLISKGTIKKKNPIEMDEFVANLKRWSVRESTYDPKTDEWHKKSLNQLIKELEFAKRYYK